MRKIGLDHQFDRYVIWVRMDSWNILRMYGIRNPPFTMLFHGLYWNLTMIVIWICLIWRDIAICCHLNGKHHQTHDEKVVVSCGCPCSSTDGLIPILTALNTTYLKTLTTFIPDMLSETGIFQCSAPYSCWQSHIVILKCSEWMYTWDPLGSMMDTERKKSMVYFWWLLAKRIRCGT